MPRKICIAGIDEYIGFAVAEVLLTDKRFSANIGTLVGLSLKPNSQDCKALADLGAKILTHKPGKAAGGVAETLKNLDADTICIIPPDHKDKLAVAIELIDAVKHAKIPSVCLISFAGCDLADKKKHPKLSEHFKIETLILKAGWEFNINAECSPVVIRPGFLADYLLMCAPQARQDRLIALPMGKSYGLAPMLLDDVSNIIAHVLGQGSHSGFTNEIRGQLIELTGPTLLTGDGIAHSASTTLGIQMKYNEGSAALIKTMKRLRTLNLAESEKNCIREYLSLVREGKTNHVSTLAFKHLVGYTPSDLSEFFNTHAESFLRPAHSPTKKRKLDNDE